MYGTCYAKVRQVEFHYGRCYGHLAMLIDGVLRVTDGIGTGIRVVYFEFWGIKYNFILYVCRRQLPMFLLSSRLLTLMNTDSFTVLVRF